MPNSVNEEDPPFNEGDIVCDRPIQIFRIGGCRKVHGEWQVQMHGKKSWQPAVFFQIAAGATPTVKE